MRLSHSIILVAVAACLGSASSHALPPKKRSGCERILEGVASKRSTKPSNKAVNRELKAEKKKAKRTGRPAFNEAEWRRDREENMRREMAEKSEEFKSEVASNPRIARHVLDAVHMREYVDAIRSGPSVVILAGSPESIVTEEARAKYSPILIGLRQRGIRVVYDGDSGLAPLFAEILGDTGLSMSSRDIANPFVRMTALSIAHQVIASPDSIAGLGLLIDGRADMVLAREAEWSNGIYEWASSVHKLGFGAHGGREVRFFSKKMLDWFGMPGREASAFKGFSNVIPGITDYQSAHQLLDALETAQILVRGETEMEALPGGAVFFGSGRAIPDYIDDAYGMGRQAALLGIPIAHGGSGGYMEISSTGAHDAGGDAIGIPLGGGYRISSEKKISSDVQTMTVGSRDYDTRIALLLYRRALVVSLPGGQGTQKEIAAAMVAIAGGQHAELAFVSDYYEKLVQWILAETRLPESFRNSIALIKDPARELPALVKHMEANLGYSPSDIRVLTSPLPRNERTQYVAPKFDEKEWWF